MYRIAMAVMLGIAPLLIAYGQFRALPGHESGAFYLMEAIRDALIVCSTTDANDLCPFPLNYFSDASSLLDATTLIFVVAARLVILIALA